MARKKGRSRSKNIKQFDPISDNFDPRFSDWALLDPIGSDRHLGTMVCTYSTLEAMARVPLIAALIQTRVNQVAEFAHKQTSPFTIGWRIVPANPYGVLSRRDRVALGQAEEVITTAGDTYFLGGFEAFLKTITRDTLRYDQVNFEPLLQENGIPYGFIPVDPTTIRRAKPSSAQIADGRWDSDETGYLQVIDFDVKAEFGFMEMAWGIRRPRSSIRTNGYGYPELEELVGTVANLVNAMTFNSVNFTTGLNAHTMITLSSTMIKERFMEAERLITAGLSGIRNFKRVPVVQLNPMLNEKLEVHALGKTNDEMQYAEWVNFLLKVICAIYTMDPTELNFIFGNEGVKNQINGNDPSRRVATSRERGLRPLLRSISSWLNYWIIQPYWPQFRFEFAGFDSVTEQEKLDMDNKAVQFWKSPNAIMRERGLPTYPHPRAEYPLNPSFDLIFQQAQAGGGMGGGQPPMAGADSLGSLLSGAGLPDVQDPTRAAGGVPGPVLWGPTGNPIMIQGPA